MGPGDLAQVLRPIRDLFPVGDYPELLFGLGPADDAAVYRLDDSRALILTLDFFPPVVDDPYTYGAIAAANALSDVYAMGGEVLFALNVAAFPKWLGREVIAEIMRGGAEKVRQAGGAIAGGHTIDDEEPKYGLCVVGMTHPDRLFTKSRAMPGDVLVLTKPLGVGIITTVLKAGIAAKEHIEGAVESMLRLNREAAQIASSAGVQSATDITGFSLLGHGQEMAQASGVALRFDFQRLPFLEGARAYADDWLFPAGSNANQDYFRDRVHFAPEISEESRLLLFTPETSGGLLLAVHPERLEFFLGECGARGQPAWAIGEVVSGSGIRVG